MQRFLASVRNGTFVGGKTWKRLAPWIITSRRLINLKLMYAEIPGFGSEWHVRGGENMEEIGSMDNYFPEIDKSQADVCRDSWLRFGMARRGGEKHGRDWLHG